MSNAIEICENIRSGRESALLGDYESSKVYYLCSLQQIAKLVASIELVSRRDQWKEVSLKSIFFATRTFLIILYLKVQTLM